MIWYLTPPILTFGEESFASNESNADFRREERPSFPLKTAKKPSVMAMLDFGTSKRNNKYTKRYNETKKKPSIINLMDIETLKRKKKYKKRDKETTTKRESE